MRRAALYIALVFLPAVLAVTPRAWAGRGPQYQYGEAWWLEYSADKATTLLLHFGPPQVSPRQRLAESVKEKIHEETLGVDLDDLEAADPDLGLGEIPAAGGPDAFKLPPVAEAAAPAGTILDYSDRRLQLKLPDGMATTAEGRFGAGLACGEGGPLRAKVGNVQFVECWFKVERLPAAPACIFSVAGDESDRKSVV